jgi:hypothetical protein
MEGRQFGFSENLVYKYQLVRGFRHWGAGPGTNRGPTGAVICGEIGDARQVALEGRALSCEASNWEGTAINPEPPEEI